MVTLCIQILVGRIVSERSGAGILRGESAVENARQKFLTERVLRRGKPFLDFGKIRFGAVLIPVLMLSRVDGQSAQRDGGPADV